MARLCPLFSSSGGNSTYVGSGGVGVLIDAGKSAKQLERALNANDIATKGIEAIFLTHEHSDHIQGLRVFASRYKIKVFASQGTMQSLDQKGVLTGGFECEIISDAGIEVAGMRIKPFKTPHDSIESVGYVIHTGNGRRAAIATDIGYMSADVKDNISGADVLMIESNHDVRMLQNGAYPYYLKRRILSDIGHLSNEACAVELPGFINAGTKRIVLAHLSRENNVPELAFQTAVCALSEKKMAVGQDFELTVAPVENFGSENIIF